MRDYTLKSVDEYIANAPEEARPKIKELRTVILSSIPHIEEGISWGQPYYRKDGLLVGFDFHKDYVRFGFGPSFDIDMRQELETKGYKTGGKTIRIRFDQKVPSDQIRQIIEAQAKLNETSRKRS